MNKAKDIVVHDPRFIGFDIKGRTVEELKLLNESKAVLILLSKMVSEILDKEIQDIAKKGVSTNVMDIYEKLAIDRRNNLERLRFTLNDNLASVVLEELKRREERTSED